MKEERENESSDVGWLVLFYGDRDAPLKDLSGLWIEGVKRKDGHIVSGHVINGMWDFNIVRKTFQVGNRSNNEFYVVDEMKIPEQMIEVRVVCKSSDYNEVIEAAREKLLNG